MTNEQFEMATQIASDEATKDEATLTSATAIVGTGTIEESNTGSPCRSGEVLRVKLVGDFPHIVTTGHPPSDPTSAPEDFTVHAVVLSADASTGDVCLISVQTGDPQPLADAEVLPIG